ncbi:MAG: hypothetical protein WAQ27_00930 [Candidatus Microsaccharimonas sp.]
MNKRQPKGFVLATMIVLSTGMLVIGVTILQTIVSVNATYSSSYQTQIATQAAEAGIAAANSCVAVNDNQQSWGPALSLPNLAANTTCTGSAGGTSSQYVLNLPKMRSSFSVGDLTVRIDGALIIKSVGTAEQLNGSGVVLSTKSVTVNQVVTWTTIFQGSATSSGQDRTCGIISNAAYCWGTNGYGQLGNSSTTSSTIPVKVTQAAGLLQSKIVTAVSSGMYHNCVLAVGKVYCWGNNYYGQLGDTTTTHRSAPIEVGGLLSGKTVTAIATSSYSTCAVADAEAYCWGRNNAGQLGINSTVNSSTPVKVTGLSGKTVTKLSTSGAGTESMCAIADDKAWCWGSNSRGQLGRASGNTTDSPVPVAVFEESGLLLGKTVTAISMDGGWTGAQTGSAAPTGNAINGHTCAIADGKAYCWGASSSGEVGRGTYNTSLGKPYAVVATSMTGTVTNILAGATHSCAIVSGEVWCWGANNFGQLGDRTYGSVASSNVPVKVAQDSGIFLGETVTQLGGGFNRGCAVAHTRTYCWGNNSSGQIGDGTSGNIRDYPVESTFLRPKAPIFLF